MTDPRGDVGVALATMRARCVIRGIDLSDYERLSEKVATWNDWSDQWTALGEHYLELADRHQAAGWPTSAGDARVRRASRSTSARPWPSRTTPATGT